MADLSSNVQITLTARDEATAQVQALQASLASLKTQQDALAATIKDGTASANAYIEADSRMAEVTKAAAAADLQLIAAKKQEAEATKEATAAQAEQSATGGSSILRMAASFGLAQLAVNALQGAFGQLRDQIKDSIAASNASQLALSGLQSTAAAFGTDALKAQDAAKRLSTDGLLTVTESANGLKNLLSSGLNLEQANQLMDVYKDRAAFGRQNTIQYGQAVQNLAESFKTQSSMIGNLSGMTENYNQIIQVGAGELGKHVSQLSAAELAQAKYLGTLKLSNGSLGDAARFADTAAGAQARLATATQNAQIMFGEALQPAVQELNKGFLELVTGGMSATESQTQQLQGTFLALVTGIRFAMDAVVGFARVFVGALESIRDGSMAPLDRAWTGTVNSMQQTWTDYNSGIQRIATGSYSNLKTQQQQHLNEQTASQKAALEKMNEQLADANKSFKEADAARKQSFEDSLRDMVASHQDKVSTIKSQLADEQAAYNDSVQQRKDNYDEQVAGLEDAHKQKVTDITQQITDERAKGVYIDGILYSQGNAKRLDALQDNLDKEDRAYATRTAKLKDKYDDEVKNAQSAYDRKREKLQESLNQEQGILQAHAADVARIGEQQKADDITRLERKFAEENSKAQTHYNDQVEKIRDAANRQGVAQISGFGAGAMAQSPALSQQFNRIGTDMGNKMSDGIKKGVHNGLRSLGGDIGNSIQGLFSGIDHATGAVSGLKAIGSAIIGGLSAIGGFLAYDSGTNFHPGGMALVGESGPELVNLPRGSSVLSSGPTQQFLQGGGSGASVHIEHFHSYNPSDAAAFADQLSWRLS